MDELSQIANLRLAVAYLGEKDQHAWWRSSFLTPLGFRIMERLTPRTPKAACVQSATQSALRVHDAAIGKGGVVHLFRFAPEFEQALQTMTSTWDESGLPTFCDSSEDAEKFLSSLASTTPKVADTITGPSHIGRADEWASSAAPARMAGVYLAAFRSGTPAFPYFA